MNSDFRFRFFTLVASPLIGAALLAGCAAVRPARMAMPEGLQARSELLVVDGVGGSTRGDVTVDGRRLRFTRSASRLSLFDGLYGSERSALDYALGGAAVSCRMRQSDSQVRWLNVPLKPWTSVCSLPSGSVQLVEAQEGVRSLQRERGGELLWGSQRWVVRSVHKLEGSALPVAEPIGYVIETPQGQAVAAVEANGGSLRLLLPRGDAVTREACLQALMALALLWG